MNKHEAIKILIDHKNKLGEGKKDKNINAVRKNIKGKIQWLQKHRSNSNINGLYTDEVEKLMGDLWEGER